jgi:LPS-assembly protein
MIGRPLDYVQIAVGALALGWAGWAVAESSFTEQQPMISLAEEVFVPSVTNVGAMCAGAYTLPERDFAKQTDANFRVAADSLEGNLDNQITLLGSVEISQRELIITAPKAEVAADSSISFVQGLQLQQPGVIMRGRNALWQRDEQTQGNAETGDNLAIENAEVVFADNGLRATAQRLARDSDGRLLIENGDFTYCSPTDDGWSLSARQLSLASESNQVITRGAVLRIKSVPVLYLPYLRLPMRGRDDTKTPRQSGFLFPELGYGDEDGVSLGVPFYLNLAANFDATVQPKLVSNRGAGLAAQARWLTLRQSSQIQGNYIPSDDIYNGVMSRRRYEQFGGFDQFGAFEPAGRWFGIFVTKANLALLEAFIDYSKLSDRDYLRDLDADFDLARDRSFDSTNPMDLQRRVELQYQQNG